MKEIDFKKLSSEFNVNTTVNTDVTEKNTENSDVIGVENPDRIIEENINKANVVLDAIILEIESGNATARMAEAASLLVNAVTNAVDKIYNKSFGLENLLVKNRMVELKDKELDIKKSVKDKGEKITESKLIVTDRETIMKIINDEEKEIWIWKSSWQIVPIMLFW